MSAPEAPASDLPFFGDGYRFSGDKCLRLGESDLTRNWLDDAADLVGCPVGDETETLVAQTNARLVDTIGTTAILSVPRR